MKRDEWFQMVRWINLVTGLYTLYAYVFYGMTVTLTIGALNIAVFVFTRKT